MPSTARAMRPYEVTRLADSAFTMANEVGVLNLKIQRPAVLSHGRELRARFNEEILERWGESLGTLRLVHEVAWEAGRSFHDVEQRRSARHEVLARLHARGLATADEIQCLLQGGFASGAMARWRTLHEVDVIAAFVAAGGEHIAERYLEHDAVSRRKGTKDYRERARDLGYEPLEAEELAVIENRYQAAIARYGRAFASDYGWAGVGSDNERPTFRDLERAVGQDRLRPYYRMANHPIHAGSHGLLWEIGAADPRVLVTGPTDKGLADPGQLTALSLTSLTRTFLTSAEDSGLQWVLYIKALDELSDQSAEALLRAHETWDRDVASAGVVVSAAVTGSPSLIAWPNLSIEDYDRILRRAQRTERHRRDVRRHAPRMRRRRARRPT